MGYHIPSRHFQLKLDIKDTVYNGHYLNTLVMSRLYCTIIYMYVSFMIVYLVICVGVKSMLHFVE